MSSRTSVVRRSLSIAGATAVALTITAAPALASVSNLDDGGAPQSTSTVPDDQKTVTVTSTQETTTPVDTPHRPPRRPPPHPPPHPGHGAEH